MKRKKKVFGKYSQEQIDVAEASQHVILLGSDFFSYEGRYTFSREKAEFYFNQVSDGLLEILETGSKSEKEEAIFCLCFLRIMPFRLH